MINCDLLIVTVPFTDTPRPLQAPAVLKAVVEKHGYTAQTYDINHKFMTSGHRDIDFLKQYYLSGNTNDLSKLSVAEDYVEQVATLLLEKFNPRFIAVSVFTYQCQTFALLLAQNIRKLNSKVKIIFGGQGLTTNGIHANDSWPKECKQLGLIDHYIIAEGENALVNLLKDGQGKGIDNTNWEQKLNIDDLPYPDYSNYKLEGYDKKTLMITGSRGCVRQCTFCDIHKHWKRFVYRSGQSIADEMISQSKKYRIYNFSFTDSLINGSMKAYRDFINVLARHNETTENKLSWGGQFIVRGINHMTEEDWVNTKKAGVTSLVLGVESGSEKVRNHMKKQFSDQDLDEFMEQAHKNNVNCTFLMIVGYPTEQQDDFIDTLKMFKRYQKYQSVIESVVLGTTLGILPGTPLAEDLIDDVDLNGGENFWVYKKNPTLDFRERIKRRMIIGEECLKMGYRVDGNEANHKLLHYLWNVYKGKLKQDIVDLNTSELHQQKYS
jgi:radical SAM superfamily enzyme YgiQ (UPF0313 family)